MVDRSLEGFRLRHGDTLDKWLFAGFAVGGGLGLYAARDLGVGEGPVTVVLVSMMLIYVAITYYLGKLKLRADQVGDNCYYLGFLYTLASLGYSLHAFSSYSRDLDAVSSIIANFGIAIFTTIFGIALRVLLHQMRVDPADVEQEARLSLAGAALRVRAELDEMVMHLNSFRAATQQSIAEAFADITSKTNSTLSTGTNSVNAAVQNAAENLDKTLTKFAEDSARLEENSTKLNRVIDTLVEKIDSIDASPDLIAKKLEPGVTGIDKLVKRLERRIGKEEERTNEIGALLERFVALAVQFEKTSAAASKNIGVLESVVQQISSADRQTAQLASAAQRAAQSLGSLDNISPKVDQSLSALTGLIQELRDGMQTSIRPKIAEPIVVTRQSGSEPSNGTPIRRMGLPMIDANPTALETASQHTSMEMSGTPPLVEAQPRKSVSFWSRWWGR